MITKSQFQDRIRQCLSESEVEQTLHGLMPHLEGSPQDIWACISFAYDKRLALRCPESGMNVQKPVDAISSAC